MAYIVTNEFTGRKYRHTSASAAARNVVKLCQKMPGFGHYITCKDGNGRRFFVDYEAMQPKSVTGKAPTYRLVEEGE